VILQALLVAYLPGALLFRLPWWNRDRRAALAFEERLFWAVILSLVISLGTVLTLAFFSVYTFPRLLAVDAAVPVTALVVGRRRLGYAGTASRASRSLLIPAGFVALGLWLYFPPSEYIIGGKDPGTYVNEGVMIAQRGALVVHDPVVASIPAAVRDVFFPPYTDQLKWYYSLRFPGFFVQDPGDGRVIGQFPHLFPASIAIGYGLHGLSGARDATGAWAILGLIAVYLAGARFLGRTAAAGGTALLAINVVEVWFARYPVSELPMQALLFAAVLAFARAADGSRLFFGALAAVLLSGMLFLRYEIVIAIATFAAAASLLPIARKHLGFTFAAVLTPIAALGYMYLVGPVGAYGAYPLDFTRAQGGIYLLAGGLLACVVALRLWRVERIASIVRVTLPIVLSTVLAALAVYAYFFRHQGGRLALHDAMAFRTLGWYLTPIGLLVAVAATAWLTRRDFWRDPAFFLTFAAYAVFFSYKTRIVPEHFWSARRFLADILPSALLLTGGLAATIGTFVGSRWLRRSAVARPAIALICLLPIGWLFWRQTMPILHHVEYAGVIPQLERLAGRIGDHDLLIVESRDAGSDLYTLAVPLVCIYARQALVLSSAAPNKRAFEDFVVWALGRYERVWFLGGGGTDLLTRRITAEPAGGGQFHVPEYASTTNAYPSGILRKDFEYGLYQLSADAAEPDGPVTLQVGGNDDLQVVRFYARERTGDTGTPFRWSGGRSFVVLPAIPNDAREIVVWMGDGGRPAQAPPATVTLTVGDREIGSAVASGKIAPHAFSLPADVVQTAAAAAEPLRVTLRVPTWNPHDLLGVNDTRDLGVMVTRVDVK
jgi:hypothetical protein